MFSITVFRVGDLARFPPEIILISFEAKNFCMQQQIPWKYVFQVPIFFFNLPSQDLVQILTLSRRGDVWGQPCGQHPCRLLRQSEFELCID